MANNNENKGEPYVLRHKDVFMSIAISKGDHAILTYLNKKYKKPRTTILHESIVKAYRCELESHEHTIENLQQQCRGLALVIRDYERRYGKIKKLLDKPGT